ncbi:MAG: SDR family NAD(P)-dependent oxidoreductase [Deltaproteobacteria bacterium]|nr:MAG: SDR family NAD(P)-dependent oxidoreductase [Deltaproteobacteria bacterium]
MPILPRSEAKKGFSMRCLIVGATGMIGRNLAMALLDEGHDVAILARKTSDLSFYEARKSQPVTVFHGDTREPESLTEAVRGVDVVYHMAGLTQIWIPNRPDRIKTLYDTNVFGVRNMARAALEGGVERFIYTSTVLSCGSARDRDVVDEESLWDLWDIPSHYLRTRILAEMEVLRFGARGMHVNILCPAIVFGTEDYQPTESGKLLIQIYRGRVPFHFKGTLLPSVALADIVAAHRLAATRGKRGEKYIICDRSVPMTEIIEAVEEVAGHPLPKYTLPKGIAPTLLPFISFFANHARKEPFVTPTYVEITTRPFHFDHAKAQRDLGLTFTPALEAVKAATAWLVEHGYMDGKQG